MAPCGRLAVPVVGIAGCRLVRLAVHASESRKTNRCIECILVESSRNTTACLEKIAAISENKHALLQTLRDISSSESFQECSRIAQQTVSEAALMHSGDGSLMSNLSGAPEQEAVMRKSPAFGSVSGLTSRSRGAATAALRLPSRPPEPGRSARLRRDWPWTREDFDETPETNEPVLRYLALCRAPGSCVPQERRRQENAALSAQIRLL
jgi:hypothetical protein